MRTDAASTVLGATTNPNRSSAGAGSQTASPVPALGLIDSLAVSSRFKGQELVSQYMAAPGALTLPHQVPSYLSVPSQLPKLSPVPTEPLSPLAPNEVQVHRCIHAIEGACPASLLPSSTFSFWGPLGNGKVTGDSAPGSSPGTPPRPSPNPTVSSQHSRVADRCANLPGPPPDQKHGARMANRNVIKCQLQYQSEPSPGLGRGLPLVLLDYHNPLRQALSVLPTPVPGPQGRRPWRGVGGRFIGCYHGNTSSLASSYVSVRTLHKSPLPREGRSLVV